MLIQWVEYGMNTVIQCRTIPNNSSVDHKNLGFAHTSCVGDRKQLLQSMVSDLVLLFSLSLSLLDRGREGEIKEEPIVANIICKMILLSKMNLFVVKVR